jgi:hypothetical protein
MCIFCVHINETVVMLFAGSILPLWAPKTFWWGFQWIQTWPKRMAVTFRCCLCIFAGQIAVTLPINREAASHVEQGRTSNFAIILAVNSIHNCMPWLVTHFKVHVATVLMQLDLRFFLEITSYVICHRRWGIQFPWKIKTSTSRVQWENI